MRGDSKVFQAFLREATVCNSAMVRDSHSVMLSIQYFLCRPRRRSILQGVLTDGFGEAVVARDIPEPRDLQSLDSCQERSLWVHKEVDLAPHPVVGLVLKEGDAEKFPQALGLESLDHFIFQSASGVHVSQPQRSHRTMYTYC